MAGVGLVWVIRIQCGGVLGHGVTGTRCSCVWRHCVVVFGDMGTRGPGVVVFGDMGTRCSCVWRHGDVV